MDINKLIQQNPTEGIMADARVIEYKSNIPKNISIIARTLVAIANYGGGLLIFGIGIAKNRLYVQGIHCDIINLAGYFDNIVKKLTTGIHYTFEEQNINGKLIVILSVDAATSTSYFLRKESSPERQIAYSFEKGDNEKPIIYSKARMTYNKVFKYMTLEAFITSMYCRTWRFFEPSKWNDKFEQRFYCANYNIEGAEDNTPQLFATCVTREKNSEAAWKVYSHGQGLGMHCVQLEINIVELRSQILRTGLTYEEKIVKYESEEYITRLHDKKNPKSGYKKYFDPFCRDSFLNLLSLKREAYRYEQEVRLFVIRKNPSTKRNIFKNAVHEDIKIDWKKIIKRVRVDKNCTPAELVSIKQACFEVGVEPVFHGFDFIPGNSTPPPGAKKVVFSAFNIDDMPGSSKIIIN